VEFLAATGVVNGYPDGRFSPDDPLTRAAAVKIGVGASEWAVRSVRRASPFPDLAASHWSTPFVTPALDEGLVLGFDDGTFRPDAPLTRAQLATLAVRTTRQSQESPPDLVLSDVKPTDWFHHPAVLAVADGSVQLGASVQPQQMAPQET